MQFSFAQQVRQFKKMRNIKIKASGITNLTDARYFAAREVEWLGFRLGEDPTNSISPLAAKAIMEWVDGVKIVGEFDFVSAETIRAINDQLHFDAIQVGMFVAKAELEQLSDLTLIKEVVVEAGTRLEELEAILEENAACCTYFLLNFEKAGLGWSKITEGSPFSANDLKSILEKYPIILALEFKPDELGEVLEFLQPYALSLTGGAEEKIGVKSFDDLDEIMDQLELMGSQA